MNRLEWLDTATRKILFLPDRKAVRKELEAQQHGGGDQNAA